MHHLITGGAGFVGTVLARRLLERGDTVHVIDDLSTGSIENVDGLRDHPGFSYTIASIFEESLLAELVDAADRIHHLAAAVGVQLIVQSPVRTIETNTHGTELVLQHASKKSKRVIFASTSEVYGKSTEFPFSEDGLLVLGAPSKGRWSYACSKALDEFLCLAYTRERGLPTTICRLFNTTGPGQVSNYGMVLPTFVKQAIRNEPLTVFGTGHQSRCFSYVEDVVNCWIALADRDDTIGEIYNIGSAQEISILDLARRVRERAESESEIDVIAYEDAYESGFEDMPRRIPDLRKLRSAIGFVPETPITQIIDAVIAYERAREAVAV